MNINKPLLKKAFCGHILTGSEIIFPTPLTQEELMQVYVGLSNELLAYRIPHYRVVGILFTANKMYTKSVVKKHDVFNQSLTELAEKASMIIPFALGGNDKNEDCYRYSDVAVTSDNNRRLDLFRGAELIPEWKRKRFPFTYNPDEIGQLVYTIDSLVSFPEYVDPNVMGTETLLFNEKKLEWDNFKRPNFLVNRVKIADMGDTKGVKLSDVVFFYHKGTGIMDYNQTAEFFKYDSDIFPCRAVYDLSTIFIPRCPMPGDTTIKYYSPYHTDFNDLLFAQVLADWVDEWEV